MARENALGQFEFIVLLALLRLGDEAYGMPIAQAIEETTGRDVVLSSVYFALERLQKKGMISSTLGEPTAERGGRAKRYFRVTARGLREVRDTRRTLTKLWRRLPQLAEDGI